MLLAREHGHTDVSNITKQFIEQENNMSTSDLCYHINPFILSCIHLWQTVGLYLSIVI